MRRILTPIVLFTLLFPSIAFGHGLICMVTGWNCPEVNLSELVKRDGLYYKKFTPDPFTGKVTGQEQGSFKDGKKHGPWVAYHQNGQLNYQGVYQDGKWEDGPYVRYDDDGSVLEKGTYKNGKKEGPWVTYYGNGKLFSKGTYKDGKREGPWVFYHDSGYLDWRATYKDGERIYD